jgi:GDP-mannose 6-dehydrogenase
MQLFCEDRQLNISDRYLRPGFSYGGSCLTKDLRALLHFGRARDLDLPVIGNIGISNDRQRADVLEEVLDTGADRVAVLGLSFKAGTDDLRESPYVDLVESLVGKGIDVRIYDTHINPARLFGANLDYVSTRLPHFSALLRESAAEALEGVDCAVVSTCDEAVATALRVDPPMHLVDVCGDLPADLESIVGYRGSAW